MRYWVSPFPLSATAITLLHAAGLQPWPERESALPDPETLLLYDSPDQLMALLETGPEADGLTVRQLLEGYQRLLGWSEQTGQPLLAMSQLRQLGSQGLRTWLEGGAAAFPSPEPGLPAPIPPLLAAVTLSLLASEPMLLDLYQDLELRAELLGRDPDLRYRERLRQAGQEGDALLQAFQASQRAHVSLADVEQRLAAQEQEQRQAQAALHHAHQQEVVALRQRLEPRLADLERRLADRDAELREAREAEEQNLQRLHQAQRELEHYFLADGQKEQQLQQRARDLEALAQRLASREAELQEARQAADKSVLQLHQVQEQLEQSFMADGEKRRQLEAGARELEELRQRHEALRDAHQQEVAALRQRFEPRLAELEQRLASRERELRDAREAAELTLLQLHQVQEELERYFLKARASEQLAEAQQQQLRRAQGLMARLHPDLLASALSPQALAVEVASELAAPLPDPSLQTEALLGTYAAGLQRASALLERARRRS